MKCAYLGHLAASWGVHQKWVAGLEEELFRQDDLEQQLSLPISPLMDRAKGGITKSQASSQLSFRRCGQSQAAAMCSGHGQALVYTPSGQSC